MKHCLTQFRSFRSPQTGSLKVGSIAPSIADLSADGNAVNAFPLWPEQSKARCLLISRSQPDWPAAGTQKEQAGPITSTTTAWRK